MIERIKGLCARCFMWVLIKMKLVTIEVLSEPVPREPQGPQKPRPS